MQRATSVSQTKLKSLFVVVVVVLVFCLLLLLAHRHRHTDTQNYKNMNEFCSENHVRTFVPRKSLAHSLLCGYCFSVT